MSNYIKKKLQEDLKELKKNKKDLEAEEDKKKKSKDKTSARLTDVTAAIDEIELYLEDK